jgi:hypothetical protein
MINFIVKHILSLVKYNVLMVRKQYTHRITQK